MPPFSYAYSYDAYDNYKWSLKKLIHCRYGLSYFLKYGDEIVLYIVGIMESNYGEDIRNWEILDETTLLEYLELIK